MAAKIIDGKQIAQQIRGELQKEIEQLKSKHDLVPGLAVVLVGENPASQVYVRNKNKTAIAQDSFIGCDAVLVAPVNIGKKSLVGAGSVVTKDVPSNTVVTGVPAKKLRKRK